MNASQTLQLSADGLIIGALYAIVGLGVVIVYRTTRVLNFAQGGVATTAGYLAASLERQHGFAYGPALLVAVAAGAALGVLIGVLMTYAFPRAGVIERSIATLGISFVLTWANRSYFGDLPRAVNQVFAVDLHAGGLIVPGHGVYVLAVAAATIAFAIWLVNHTTLGLAMRALSADAPIARAFGVSHAVVSVASWTIASALGALSGVLVASFIQVDQSVMTTISIQSLSALVLGGFGSPLGAIVGGVALGLASSLAAGFLDPAYKNTLVFGAVLLMLVLRPQGLVGRGTIIVYESGGAVEVPSLPPRHWLRPTNLILLGVAAALMIGLPFIPQPFPLITYSVLFATATVAVGLSFLMGFIGEVSLGHGALATVGAYVCGFVLAHSGALSLPLALVLAIALTAGVGAVVGYATLRLSGVYLAIATLALTFVVTELALRLRAITGGAAGIGVVSPFGHDRLASALGIYYLSVGGFALTAAIVLILLRSRLGIYWVAIRDIPIAAAVNGVAVSAQKVLAFSISSAIAGLGGALLAIVITHVGPADYGLDWSFLVILAVVLGGTGSILGALGGSAVITLLPVAVNRTTITDLIFGAAIVLLIAGAPAGLPALLRRLPGGWRRADEPELLAQSVPADVK